MKPLFRSKGSYNAMVIGSKPLIYFPMNDPSGLVAKNWGTLGVASDGAYTGVDLRNMPGPKGGSVPYFDGANDFLNLYSAAMASAFNGNLGTLMVWIKARTAGIWTDATTRYIAYLKVDSGNYLRFYKTTTDNQFIIARAASTHAEQISTTSMGGSTAWHCILMHWDDAGTNEVRHYIDGSQVGSTIEAYTFVGSLASDQSLAGAGTSVPNYVWDGYLAHLALWDRVLTPAEISMLA
jgi:hypothetical protein